MKINDVLEGLIIESLASDPVTGLQAGRIYYNSTTNEVRKYNGSAWDIVVDGLSTQSLSNKTLVGPVVTGGAQIDNVTVTGTASNGFAALRNQSANPSAVTNYTKVFPKTDDKLYSLDQLGVEREIVQSLAGTATVAALSAGKVTVTGTAGAGFQEIAGQSATPTPPAVGYVRLYAKPDNKLYIQDSAGNESAVGTGSGGTVVKVALAAHGFALGEALYLNSGNFTRGIATASNTAEIVGVVSTVVDPNNFELTLSGKVTGLSGLTPGGVYFLSATVAGQLTLVEPTTIGHVSVPIGVADSATTLLVGIKRGVVLGGTNARTSLPLANNAITTIQDVAAYDAGELSGWVYINTTSAKRFFITIPFAKNGAGTDYNVSYETVGDIPPAGFTVTVTSAGLIRITLPLISPFTSALINFALNVPAVGATFPLSIDAATIATGTVGSARLPVYDPTVSASGILTSGLPGIASGSVGVGIVGEDQFASLTAIYTKNPAGNAVWEDVPGSSITIARGGKFLLTVDVPTYFAISGGNTNSNYVIQASIRTSGPTLVASSAFSVYVSAGSLINPSLFTIPITGIVTAITGQQFFLSVRYFYGGAAADAGTKEVGTRGDTNNYVFKAVRIA